MFRLFRQALKEATPAKALSVGISKPWNSDPQPRPLKISVCLPAEIAMFYDEVRAGIYEARADYSDRELLPLDIRSYPRLGYEEEEAIQNTLADGCDGLLIAPGHPHALRIMLERARNQGTKVACVTTDTPEDLRDVAVTSNAVIAGGLAAELLGVMLQGSGEIVVIVGDLSTADHMAKIRSFRNSAKSYYPNLSVLEPLEAHDEPEEARHKMVQLLSERPNLKGIYIATANSETIIETLDAFGKAAKLKVIATDRSATLESAIEGGGVSAILDQRPRAQGKAAFHHLYRVLKGMKCDRLLCLPPAIVLRSNVRSH